MDISRPSDPRVTWTAKVSTIHDLAASRGMLYAVSGNGAFQVWNIANPASPTFARWMSSPATGIEIIGNDAFLARPYTSPTGPGTISVFDLSSPADPRAVDEITTDGGVRSLGSGAGLILAGDAGSRLNVVEIAP